MGIDRDDHHFGISNFIHFTSRILSASFFLDHKNRKKDILNFNKIPFGILSIVSQ
jgi:hypothetical protein